MKFVQRNFSELKSNFPTIRRPSKIFWLSRHFLDDGDNTERKVALLALHGGYVQIEQCADRWPNVKAFIHAIKCLSKKGFVYVLIPRDYLSAAIEGGLSFGYFNNHPEPDGNGGQKFILRSVIHVKDKVTIEVFTRRDLEQLMAK